MNNPTTQSNSTTKTPFTPDSKLIELYKRGLTNTEISKIIGRDVSLVTHRLNPYKAELDFLPTFKDFREDMLDIIEYRLIDSFTKEDIQKASFRDRSVLFGIINDKRSKINSINNQVNLSVIIQQAHSNAQSLGSNESKVIIDVDKLDK